MLSVEDVAGVCHEANWALCQAVGDVASHWAVAPDWQQQSAIQGVIFAISHPEATPEDQHNAWLDAKRHDGWCYGPIKNEMEKTHPCFLAYADLPAEQKSKDVLFRNVVKALTPFVKD